MRCPRSQVKGYFKGKHVSHAPTQVGQGLRPVQLNNIFEVIGLREDGLREIRDENT